MESNVALSRLAKIRSVDSPVVSVYLNTRWADEHQRERVRVFLKNELRKVRQGAREAPLAADLDWIETQGEALVEQTDAPEAQGVALFACGAQGLREMILVRVPFEDAFVVADTPFLRPLAAMLEDTPPALVVFVDGKRARLIPVRAEGTGEEVTLESEVPGHHRRGGWAQLAQSRYQRHIEDHRGRHFDAVAAALARLTEGDGLARIVIAGEPRSVAAFRKHLPQPLAARVAGQVPASRYEPASVLTGRAAELLERLEHEEGRATVEAVLTEAAKSGRAVAGLAATLDATNRAAVHRLYLLKGFRGPGRVCVACGGIESDASLMCRKCGEGTKAVEIGEALVDHVLSAGGTVEVVESHAGLGSVGGVAARLRYPV